MSGIIKPGDSDFPNMFGFITEMNVTYEPGDVGYIEFHGMASGSPHLDAMIANMYRGTDFPYYSPEFMCLHCGSPQPIDRTHCAQCGAPRSFILG